MKDDVTAIILIMVLMMMGFKCSYELAIIRQTLKSIESKLTPEIEDIDVGGPNAGDVPLPGWKPDHAL